MRERGELYAWRADAKLSYPREAVAKLRDALSAWLALMELLSKGAVN